MDLRERISVAIGCNSIMNYKELAFHKGHKIVCVVYDKVEPVEATIECETCYEILYSEFENPEKLNEGGA